MPDPKFPHRWVVAIRGGEEHIEITVDEQKRIGVWFDGAFRIMTSDDARRVGTALIDAVVIVDPDLIRREIEQARRS